jgi:hypothetical protein
MRPFGRRNQRPSKEVTVRSRIVVAVLSIAAACLTCSSLSVTIDYDQEVDFTQYETFDWIRQKSRPPGRRGIDHSLAEKKIRTAAEQELFGKGFRRATRGKPDLLVAFHIGARDKIDVTHYGYRYGPHGRWVGRNVQVHHYKEGTLILDFVDPDMQQLVWRGTAVDAVMHPRDLEKKLVEAVVRILRDFPPE